MAVLVTAVLCLPAIGQDTEKLDTGEAVPAAEQGANRLPMQVMAGGSYQFKSDLDNGGHFSLWRFRTGLGVPVRINDQFSVATSVKYERDFYVWGGGLEPWSDINILTAVSLLQYRYDEHWLFYGGPIVRSAGESGENLGNGTRAGGALAVNYIANESLSYGGGIVVMGQIEEKTKVLPIITAKWKFTDDWMLDVGFTDLATGGYGADVRWDFHPGWQLAFGGQVHQSRFRIEGNGGTANGVGQEKAFTLTTAVTWSPDKAFSADAFVGLVLGGRVELDTANGTQLRDDKYDPTAIVGLKATYKF